MTTEDWLDEDTLAQTLQRAQNLIDAMRPLRDVRELATRDRSSATHNALARLEDATALLEAARLIRELEQHIGDGYDDESDEQCPFCLWVPGRDWDPVHSSTARTCDLIEARRWVRAAGRAGL